MGSSVSLESIKIIDKTTPTDKEKYLVLDLSNGKKILTSAIELSTKIKKEEYIGKSEYEIDFCLGTPYSTVYECAYMFKEDGELFYTSNLDGYVVTAEGSDCIGLTFRQGTIISKSNSWLEDRVYNGKRCKIKYVGDPITQTELEQCCTGLKTSDCYFNLRNGFTTNHCNVTMMNYCKNNIDNAQCVLWLQKRTEQMDDTAMRFYYEYCKDNFDKPVCDYMCMYSRISKFYNYCDSCLIEWCNKHKDDPRCYCLLTPDDLVNDEEQLIGPKECWLKECNVSDMKWLTSNQIEKKSNCKITTCSISIDSIQSSKPNIKLYNNCQSINQVGYVDSNIQITDDKYVPISWGIVSYLGVFLLLIILGYMVYINNINTFPSLDITNI